MKAARALMVAAAAALALPGAASAQLQLTPQAAEPAKPAAKPAAPAKKPAPKSEAAPKPAAPVAGAPQATPAGADLAYGAYQRGYFLTAFLEATKRVDKDGDRRAMTLLGELYAQGLGVPSSDKKAIV